MKLLQSVARILRDLCRPGRKASSVSRAFQPSLENLEDRCVPSTSSGSIAFNFNGTPIAAGNTLWFSSAFKVSGLGSSPATIHFSDDTISFTANGVDNTVNAPNADVTLSPTATIASTSFDSSLNAWETTLPMKFSGNAFLDGVAVPLPNGLPGGIKNVTWRGQFSSDTAGLSVNWQWAAAAYTNFGSDYNALNVKPVDDNHLSAYQNSHHAGTPEAFLPYVTGGATGGGGSNFTGSLSSTQSITPALLASLSGFVTTPNGTPLAEVVILLTTTDSNGQTVTVSSTTTDSNGFYQFSGVSPGAYSVSAVAPSGYQPSSAQPGTVNGSIDGDATSNSSIGSINLVGGNIGINYDFLMQKSLASS